MASLNDYLLGISRFKMGSKPTHLTPAFSQGAQAGSRWSQRFLRMRQRLQADTLRKDDAAAEVEDVAVGEGILELCKSGAVS